MFTYGAVLSCKSRRTHTAVSFVSESCLTAAVRLAWIADTSVLLRKNNCENVVNVKSTYTTTYMYFCVCVCRRGGGGGGWGGNPLFFNAIVALCSSYKPRKQHCKNLFNVFLSFDKLLQLSPQLCLRVYSRTVYI